MNSLPFSRRISALEEVSLTNKICTFIAEQLGVDVEGITINSHLSDDLGLDLLDVIELTILLEDEFTNGRIKNDAGQMGICRRSHSPVEAVIYRSESALPQLSDVGDVCRQVAFVPQPDIPLCCDWKQLDVRPILNLLEGPPGRR
jgi:acyl carrier protein